MDVGVLLAVGLLGALHVVGARLPFLTHVPRSAWLSFAGGVSVSYVFVHLLPEVARGSELLAEEIGEGPWVEEAVWLLVLLGLSFFYWIESFTRRSKGKDGSGRSRSAGPFWASIASYGIYNSVVGYLLPERAAARSPELALFVTAMGLHFVVNDIALQEHHRNRYRSVGRWVLVAAIAVGAVVGMATDVRELIVLQVIAFIGGGVILNVFKEELPTEAESRFSAFLAGAGLYALVLVAL